MKLHLPSRLRSALLACLAVVAPLAGTVATGTFVGAAAMTSLSLSVAQAATIEVPAGTTEVYDASNAYIVNGGTLQVDSGVVTSAITIGAEGSTVSLGSDAVLSPLRVSLAEGVTAYNLIGTGTYDLASATDMYGAVASSVDWTGTVSITKATGVGNFNINNYGNANSTVKLSGVAGWLALGVAFSPTLLLEDASDASAFNQTDGSTGREYAFSGVVGNGTFERGGTKFSGAVSYAFAGDVSGWKGNFLNNFGQTTLIFRGAATEINLETITHNAGYAMGLKFDGASATVVNSLIQSTGGGAINMTINNTGGVTFNKNAAISELTVNGSMTVGAGAQMTVSNAASFKGDVTVDGTLNLDSGVTLTSSIVNNGTLNISGVMTVTSENLAQRPVGDVSFSDGDNGVQKSGSVEYTVIENAASAKLNVSNAILSFDGSNDLKLTSGGKVVREADVTDTRYWVNKGEVLFDSTNAPSYYMNGGILVMNKADAAAQGAALVGLDGSRGTVKLTKDARVVGGVSTKSAADLLITDGATLSVGDGKNSANYINSFSSVTLDNGKLAINALPGAIQNLTVTANNGEISFPDYMNGPTVANAYSFSGVTKLDGRLTVTGSYKFVARFERLSGAGSMEFNGPTSGEDTTQVLIDSLQGFTGDLSFVQNNGSNPYYKVTLNSGSTNVEMNSLTLGKGAAKGADQNNIDMLLSVGTGMTLNNALTLQSNAALTVNGADGLKLKGGLVVQGVDNSIIVQDGSALNLGTLSVTDGAALSLLGKYSALAMNQMGEVSLSDMQLVDGASLVYGADAATLRIGADNLMGSIKIDLNSLTDTQSLAIAEGFGLELGIAAEVDRALISVVANNVRDAVLDNRSGSWKLVSGVVSQYWEAGSGNWNSGDPNWAFRDEASADKTTFIGGTDAIFSGDADATVTIGENIDVQNIETYDGKYHFNSNFIGNLSVKNDLLIGENSEVTFTTSVASTQMNVAGKVEVAQGSVLTVDHQSMTVSGGLSGAGSMTVDSDLSLGDSSSMGQLVVDGEIKMIGTPPAGNPNKRVTDLTVGGASSAGALTNVGRLTVGSENSSMKISSATVLGSLAGQGAVEVVNADLTLTSGASSIGSVKASSLTLNKGVTLNAGTLAVPEVNMSFSASVVESGAILTVGKTTGASGMSLTVDSVDSLKKLTNGQRVTIATIGQPGGAVTVDMIAPIAPGVTEWAEKEGFSVTANLRGFGYELKVSDDNKLVSVVVGRDNSGWIGSESTTWVQGAQTGWEKGYIPNEYDRAAGFFGEGSSIVKVDAAGVKTALVDVDIAMDKLDEKPSYTFEGGQVTADNMVIGQGELIIANSTHILQDTQVYTNGKLTVAGGGKLMNEGSVSMTDNVSLTVDKDGEFSVGGNFSAEESVTITNAGTFAAESVEIVGDVENTGILQVSGSGFIGSVKGGSVSLFDNRSDCTLVVGSIDVDRLTISGGNSELKLTGDSVIGSLCGKEGVEGGALTSTAAVTLKEAAEGGLNLSASELTLNSIGNEFGAFNVPRITLDIVNGSSLSTDVAALKAESMVVGSPLQITLTQATIEGLPLGEDGIVVTGDYKLISGVSGYSVDNFSVADAVMQEIRRRGVEAGLNVTAGELVLSLGEIEGGMTWNTAEGQLTNNGYEVPTGAGLYKALDYVEHVLVPGNKTIDLTADGVGSASTDASEASVGLIIRNLDGGGRLTLIGDAPGEDGALPDAATLLADAPAEKPVALVGDSLLVNVGLPKGAEGVLPADASSNAVVLASAEMTNGAVLQVNAATTVTGKTDLSKDAELVVAEGAVLVTHQLDGDATASLSGRVNIDGVGGTYEGTYGAGGADVELQQGAFQSLRAGKGLSLSVYGGEGTLDFAGVSTEMTKLGVGTRPGSADKVRSELIISNVTIDDDAKKVEHHTLKLTGGGSYIADSELTASLGAEETARTLGTDRSPVILDGEVNVSNSVIRLTMVTTNDDLRSLDVNTDAPMSGARLATLATGGSISADNAVELIGTRAMMNVVNKYYTNARLDANGDVLVDRVTDYYAAQSSGLSETGQIGVGMLDKVLVKLNPQAKSQVYPDLNEVLNALDDAVVAGNTTAADELASSVTGASAAAMGAALAGDMERQLRAIRNRTTTMGVDQSSVNHNMPYFNAWINAEYDSRTLDEDGTLSGYDYSVTGGTVGFDVDITPRFVCGLAVSALSGDVSSEGPDELEADVDSYYLTAFARTTHRRWTHTFVASVGKSDLSIDRTVSFSGGGYRTKGETDAMSFGAMYELGYVFALDADATTCLQPVFNVSVAHSSMDGYTESGSDAALEIGSVDMTTITIGMGARLQAVVGQNVFNRASIFESRALIKVNAGDREAEVESALTSLPSAAGKVSSAERGPISLELGAGITVPVGAKSGSIFVDGSAELGSEYTGLNATVGYRLNF